MLRDWLWCRQRLRAASVASTSAWTQAGWRGWCKVVSVYDGDTATLVLAGRSGVRYKARMLGIDTEELRQPRAASDREAKADLAFRARNALASMASDVAVDPGDRRKGADWDALFGESRRLVWCECEGEDLYGRMLVHLRARRGAGPTFSDALIEQRLALPYDGQTKTPVYETLAATDREAPVATDRV